MFDPILRVRPDERERSIGACALHVWSMHVRHGLLQAHVKIMRKEGRQCTTAGRVFLFCVPEVTRRKASSQTS